MDFNKIVSIQWKIKQAETQFNLIEWHTSVLTSIGSIGSQLMHFYDTNIICFFNKIKIKITTKRNSHTESERKRESQRRMRPNQFVTVIAFVCCFSFIRAIYVRAIIS